MRYYEQAMGCLYETENKVESVVVCISQGAGCVACFQFIWKDGGIRPF